jgi:protein phosphatase
MNSQTLPLQTSESPGPRAQPNVRWKAGGYTHAGQRRHANEDSFLVATFQRMLNVIDSSDLGAPLDPETHARHAAHGRRRYGRAWRGRHRQSISDPRRHRLLGARTALRVRHVRAALSPDARTSLHGVRSKLASALLMGDEAIRTEASAGAGEAQMGTTFTLAVLTGLVLYVAHVGDSRCYLHRNGARCIS